MRQKRTEFQLRCRAGRRSSALVAHKLQQLVGIAQRADDEVTADLLQLEVAVAAVSPQGLKCGRRRHARDGCEEALRLLDRDPAVQRTLELRDLRTGEVELDVECG